MEKIKYVLDYGVPQVDDTQHATKKELRIFVTTNCVYDVAKIKPLRISLLMLPYRKRKTEGAKKELQ